MIPRLHTACGLVAALASAVVALAAPTPAEAGKRPPPDQIAAVEVYREQLPTARGPRVTGERPGPGVPLAPAASNSLSGQRGEPLKRVATSPAFGAPERRLPPPSPEKADDAAPEAAEPDEQALDAAIAVADDTGSGRLLGLALGLLALTAILGGVAAVRRRRTDG